MVESSYSNCELLNSHESLIWLDDLYDELRSYFQHEQGLNVRYAKKFSTQTIRSVYRLMYMHGDMFIKREIVGGEKFYALTELGAKTVLNSENVEDFFGNVRDQASKKVWYSRQHLPLGNDTFLHFRSLISERLRDNIY